MTGKAWRMWVKLGILDSFASDEPFGCGVIIKARSNHYGERNQNWY